MPSAPEPCDDGCGRASMEDLFLRYLFLVAMAIGHLLGATPGCPTPEVNRFNFDHSAVTLDPQPMFLAKNDRKGHRINPSSSQPGERMAPGTLALETYIKVPGRTPADALWVHHRSLIPLRTRDLAKKLVLRIRQSDPESHPRAHQVKKYASSLVFF